MPKNDEIIILAFFTTMRISKKLFCNMRGKLLFNILQSLFLDCKGKMFVYFKIWTKLLQSIASIVGTLSKKNGLSFQLIMSKAFLTSRDLEFAKK